MRKYVKIRQGFISNSSSTSFIVAVIPAGKCEHCGRSDVNIFDQLKDKEDYNGNTYLQARGYKEVIKILEQNIEYGCNKDILEEQIVKVKLAAGKGKEIGILRIPYEDSYLEIIRCMGNIEILNEENE